MKPTKITTTFTCLFLLLFFSFTNLQYSQEINLLGNAVSIIDGDITAVTTDFTDFGTLNSRTYTIRNLGGSNLTIGAITFLGANASEFSITSFPNSTITPGGNSTFTISFNPTSAGIKNAIINIVNNDSNENPYDFALKATGIAREINIAGNATSIVDGDTTPSLTDFTDFGNSDVNSGTNTKFFTIQNLGTLPLTIGAISFTGANASEFSIISFPTSTVLGNSSTTFQVKFTTATLGIRTATLNIVNDDSNENPYDFSLKATGVAATLEIYGGIANNSLVPDNATTTVVSNYTDFQSTNISSPIYRTFTIKNLGGSVINLTGSPVVSISGSSDFVVTTQAITPVPITGSRTFVITFTPSSVGIKTATISIANSDAGANKNPYNFTISGEGVQKFIDTDSDGIFDHIDADDDNDGIPDVKEQSFSSGNTTPTTTDLILLNETFGTSTTRARINVNIPTATTDYCYEDGTSAQAFDECDTDYSLNDGNYSVSNTAQCASWAAQYWYTGLDHTTGDVDGRMGLFNATISTTAEFYRTVVQGVILGAPVTYSFWALNLDRADAPGIATRPRPQLEVEFFDLNNNIIPGSKITTGNVPPSSATSNLASDWYFYTVTFTPITTNGFSIVFRNKQIGGGGNDLAIDDIIVKQTLTDADGDGGADVFDLDSDNDGIGGIIEDGWENLSNGKDTMSLIPVASGGTWIDANNNGWHDTTEAYYATQNQRDFDGDGVPNYVDLDSDNDSQFDVDEAGIFNGDGDVNCDGAGEGDDLDKDGILSKFDSFAGFANGSKSLPKNTLVTGNADYLKLSSQISGVTDISKTLYANLDGNGDGIIDGTTDADKDGIRDAFDTNTNYFGSPRDLNRKLFLDFDGRNDYGEATPVLAGLSQATIMAWINWNNSPTFPFVADGIIAGQNNFNIKLNAAKNLVVTLNSTTSVTYSTVSLNPAQWYNVAAILGNGELKLYLNGVFVKSTTTSASIATDSSLLTIGKNSMSNSNYFKGKIDELRLFNIALTESQLQRMVYQEVSSFGTEVRGDIIPKNIGTLPFANLIRYYKMDVYKSDIIDDLSTPTIDVSTGMKIFNNKNIYKQEAPLPFVTERTGDFATAVNSTTREIRGQDCMDNDWSITIVKHNIIEPSNTVDLGMIIDPSVTVTANNNNKIQNDWYLYLGGKIDLQDKSQLVQTINSDLDVTSIGSIERDQKGNSNIYNYNYWSSPTGAINATTNNNSYTVATNMKDATDTNNIKNILWTSSYNGLPGTSSTAITLSSSWIYKFQNTGNNYYNWSYVGPNGTLLPSQGYTLKGSGAVGSTQNYTFTGKPNNGTITTAISANNLILAGNPYASALDSKKFIQDNIASTTGTLYFWEHYATNNTHVTANYQGGYAARNLVGGTPPISPSTISGLGSSTRIPSQFIPVAQGFFIVANATGGNISFNNSQRNFVKEDNALSNSMFKNVVATSSSNGHVNNDDVITNTENFKKLRLGFDTFQGYHRQTLLGFMDEFATSAIDMGYDAIHIDNQPSDMYFLNGTTKIIINGESYFDINKSYPLGIKSSVQGQVKFMIDAKENFDDNQNIYIFDSLTNTYNNITNDIFTVEVPQGIIENRFTLTFKNTAALGTSSFANSDIKIAFANVNSTLLINNNLNDTTVKSIEIFNILGQSIATYDVKNQSQTNIIVPIKTISTGTYIVKVITDNGYETSKKIIVN